MSVLYITVEERPVGGAMDRSVLIIYSRGCSWTGVNLNHLISTLFYYYPKLSITVRNAHMILKFVKMGYLAAIQTKTLYIFKLLHDVHVDLIFLIRHNYMSYKIKCNCAGLKAWLHCGAHSVMSSQWPLWLSTCPKQNSNMNTVLEHCN